ncbi:MAG: AAA family ATPase [Candidatus Pacebacteria bacterium]|nr:AAA family ATPase [Candidatus Paceibacterota bacterium]
MENGFENEKRFLVLSFADRSRVLTARKKYIDQGYFDLAESFKTFRVRIEDGREASVTFKEGSGFSRKEKPKEIKDLVLANFLMQETSHQLQKTRFFPGYQINGAVLTVDFYEPPLSGIAIAEVEFENQEFKVEPSAIVKPPWVKEWNDVTETLSNIHLARLASELRGKGADQPPPSFYEGLLTKRIPKIVLTGPPCSGKSALMKTIEKEMGDKVHCIQEVASILISQAGINPEINPSRFNVSAYRVQNIFESTSEAQAIEGGKLALLTDRGNPDIASYTKNGWHDFTKLVKTNKDYELKRYQLVIYLELPPREVYEKFRKNNPARKETYEEAFQRGERLKEAWKDHPNFLIISNYKSWEEKEKITIYIIKKFLSQQ